MALDVAATEQYIRTAARQRGIDPDVAVRVARSEGLQRGTWQSNVVRNGQREPSYGPFQLLVGGPGTGFPAGMGNDFIRDTGLDPSDPANARAAIDYALDKASQNGWGAWYGAADAGIGRREGIGTVTAESPTPPSREDMQLARAEQPDVLASDTGFASLGDSFMQRDFDEINEQLPERGADIEAGIMTDRSYANSQGPYSTPLDQYTITSDFGPRTLRGRPDQHNGIDLRAAPGTPVRNIREGVVETTRTFAGTGMGQVVVRHRDGSLTQYTHADPNGVKPGDRVAPGQVIATVTQTDEASTGSHLDIKMRNVDGQFIDPEPFMDLAYQYDEYEKEFGTPLPPSREGLLSPLEDAQTELVAQAATSFASTKEDAVAPSRNFDIDGPRADGFRENALATESFRDGASLTSTPAFAYLEGEEPRADLVSPNTTFPEEEVAFTSDAFPGRPSVVSDNTFNRAEERGFVTDNFAGRPSVVSDNTFNTTPVSEEPSYDPSATLDAVGRTRTGGLSDGLAGLMSDAEQPETPAEEDSLPGALYGSEGRFGFDPSFQDSITSPIGTPDDQTVSRSFMDGATRMRLEDTNLTETVRDPTPGRVGTTDRREPRGRMEQGLSAVERGASYLTERTGLGDFMRDNYGPDVFAANYDPSTPQGFFAMDKEAFQRGYDLPDGTRAPERSLDQYGLGGAIENDFGPRTREFAENMGPAAAFGLATGGVGGLAMGAASAAGRQVVNEQFGDRGLLGSLWDGVSDIFSSGQERQVEDTETVVDSAAEETGGLASPDNDTDTSNDRGGDSYTGGDTNMSSSSSTDDDDDNDNSSFGGNNSDGGGFNY